MHHKIARLFWGPYGLDLRWGVVTMSRLQVPAALAVAAFFALFGSAARAADDNFGAIAFSSGTGATGYSYDYDSRDDAEEPALQECGPGCKVVLCSKMVAARSPSAKATVTGLAGRRAEPRLRTWRSATAGKTPADAKSAGGRARRGEPPAENLRPDAATARQCRPISRPHV
jgi:hypothetical protein